MSTKHIPGQVHVNIANDTSDSAPQLVRYDPWEIWNRNMQCCAPTGTIFPIKPSALLLTRAHRDMWYVQLTVDTYPYKIRVAESQISDIKTEFNNIQNCIELSKCIELIRTFIKIIIRHEKICISDLYFSSTFWRDNVTGIPLSVCSRLSTTLCGR